MSHVSRANLARFFLLFSTAMWGMSFPIIKALRSEFYCQAASELTQTAAFVFARFSVVFVIYALWVFVWKKVGKVSKEEFYMGGAMGIMGGIGVLFQSDGLAYTGPGTSAFLTQMTCVLVPLVALLRRRRRITPLFATALMMGIGGVYLLSGFDVHRFTLGRGEAETLLCATFFSVQILLLESVRWKKYVNLKSTAVMFFFFAAVNLPFFKWTQFCMGASGASPLMIFSFMTVIVIVCSLLPYSLMVYWQPEISGTEATFIYTLEALFTLCFNFLWIPLLFKYGGYKLNLEIPSLEFALGAFLLISANFFLFAESYRKAKKAAWKT